MAEETGFATMGRAASRRRHPGDRRRNARLRVHGEGALERLQDASLHGVAAAAHAAARGDRRARRRGGHRGRAPVRLRACHDRLARPGRRPGDRPLRQRRPERPPRRADDRRGRGRQARRLREAARPRRDGVLRNLAEGRADGRRAHVRVQLPLRAGRAARPTTARERRARGDPPLPRPVPPGVGCDRRRRRGGSRRGGAGSGALGDLGTHVVDLARYLVGEIDTVSAETARLPARPRGRRRVRGRRASSRTARSERSRPRASPRDARTPSAGRSTARRGRWRSTWSG